ncbi:hypothetical protein EDI_289650 [Entamoeba dispar SAW760]|uniref:Transmembrane protein n=1 Tax=Entamoeba dispar (strain ATCC PRA-260 / SAW760) TaxID=370354 RepID=B0EVB9_ENTDS|nr:uncharacterized protein EDI_289650 [Entamoeba dispar SAW760]EDR21531.1 hypothetical protein EDI_289650 [Entamoeba dispar SAW760]|eukprot:EDR21531.1 hypothetical protein EDI_289650 [Entamoeba dispar SAW760]
MADEQNEALGYVCVIVAVLCFGSNFTVVKKFPTGDGFFFQWVMSIGILIVGIFSLLFYNVINKGTIYFEPFAMLGGLIWCTGNLLCVPVIQLIGLSLGPGIWGVGNMVMGWLTGTFGWFGLNSDKDNVKIFWLNCVGAALAACSVPCYALIKTSTKVEREALKKVEEEAKDNEIELSNSKENKAETSKSSSTSSRSSDEIQHPEEDIKELNDKAFEQEPEEEKSTIIVVSEEESPIFKLLKAMPKWLQMIVGLILAITSGILFGSAFDPAKYLQDNGLASPEGINYVLAHFLGIFLSSTFYFICYIITFRNKPFIYRETILPGMVSGIMWAIAQVCWFVANTNLPYVVSYPLICAGPGLLSALWGIIVFGEIRGWKNFLFFAIGTLILIGGIVCIVVSK